MIFTVYCRSSGVYCEYTHGRTVPVRTSRVPPGHAAAPHTPSGCTVYGSASVHTAALGPAARCSIWPLHGHTDCPHANELSGTGAPAWPTQVMPSMDTALLHVSGSRPQHGRARDIGDVDVDSVLSFRKVEREIEEGTAMQELELECVHG